MKTCTFPKPVTQITDKTAPAPTHSTQPSKHLQIEVGGLYARRHSILLLPAHIPVSYGGAGGEDQTGRYSEQGLLRPEVTQNGDYSVRGLLRPGATKNGGNSERELLRIGVTPQGYTAD